MLRTWVGENLLGLSDVYELLLSLLLLHLVMEVVWVPHLRQLPVSFDDFLLLGRSGRVTHTHGYMIGTLYFPSSL